MNSATFVLTNVVPQVHELNGGPWEKLEQYERSLARRPDAVVYIVAGPIFGPSPQRIGPGVAVPKATFKIIVDLTRGDTPDDVTSATRVVAVVMPNERDVEHRRWTDFLTTVDEIERQTGYDFLARVPDPVEAVIEARVATP